MWCDGVLLLTALAQRNKHAQAEAQRRIEIERAAEAYKNGMPFTLGQLFGVRSRGEGPPLGAALLTANKENRKQNLDKKKSA